MSVLFFWLSFIAIVEATGITAIDVVTTLQLLDLVDGDAQPDFR